MIEICFLTKYICDPKVGKVEYDRGGDRRVLLPEIFI